MVERPIKKSERQTKEQSHEADAPESTDVRRETRPPRKKDPQAERDQPQDRDQHQDRRKGKKRGDRRDGDVDKPPVNPALMRGPKPSPAKPPEPEPEPLAETPDAVSEELTSTELEEVAATPPSEAETDNQTQSSSPEA